MRLRRHAPAALFFLVASIAMTWPLARILRLAVADPSDPYLNTWVLDWDWFATFVSPRPLFEANIFYPTHLALAFSENLFGLSLLIAPFRALGMAPLTAHNVLLLLGFAACGFSAYLLGTFATGSRTAGIIGGIVYAFVPWRFTHLTHVQYAWTAALPLLLLALLRYDGSKSRAIPVAAATIFAGSTNLHVFAFGGVAAAATVAVIVARERDARNARWITNLAIAVVVGVVILLPLLLPYRRAMRAYHLRGDVEETLRYSAVPSDWLVSNFHNRFYLPLGTNNGTTDPERWLFPGLGSLLLTTIAFIRKPVARTPLIIAAAWIVLGFLGSLGLHFPLHGLLFKLGLFKGIRAPARWAMVAHAGLALAAACGASRMRRVTKIAVAIALLIELHAAPVRWFMTTGRAAAIDQWLATAQPNAILNLPVNEANSEFIYVLGAATHHRPIVNGPGFASIAFRDLDFSKQRLTKNGVDLVVVHGNLLGTQAAAVREFIGRSELKFVRQIENDFVFTPADRFPAAADRTPVDRFLRGDPPDNSAPFGALDVPAKDQRVAGKLTVIGWAIARSGVREVNLLLNNGGMKVRAGDCSRPDVQNIYLNYPPTALKGFCSEIERPWWIPQETDVQVEIIDSNGTRVRLTDRWFTWLRK